MGLGVDYDKILTILQKYRNHFRYQPGRPPVFRWKLNLPEPAMIKMVLHTLELIQGDPSKPSSRPAYIN